MRKSLCVAVLVLVLGLAGCGKPKEVSVAPQEGVEAAQITLSNDYLDYISPEDFAAKGHEKLLPDYQSDVSVAYQNADGSRTLYVFASPINMMKNGEFVPIDTRLCNIKSVSYQKQGYLYEANQNDIQARFHQFFSRENGVKISKGSFSYEIIAANDGFSACEYAENEINFIGEIKNMAVYDGAWPGGARLKFYPSLIGANCEISFKDNQTHTFYMGLKMDVSGVKIRQEPGEYWIFYRNVPDESGENAEEILGVIQTPLLKNQAGNISCENQIKLKKERNGNYLLEIQLDKAVDLSGATAYLSFEARREKQPDNCLYSGRPRLKYAYLKNISLVGNSEKCGLGRLMVRFKFAKDLGLKASQIKGAAYSVFNLTPERADEFELLRVLEDWCSLTGNWKNNYKTGDRVALQKSPQNILTFDLTDEVKIWCADETGEAEHNGVQLKSTGEKLGVFSVLLSNDNALFNNFTEIKLS